MGIIVIVAVVGLAVWLLMQTRQAGRGFSTVTRPVKVETALEVLKKRYASGEIGRDEFEARRRDLV